MIECVLIAEQATVQRDVQRRLRHLETRTSLPTRLEVVKSGRALPATLDLLFVDRGIKPSDAWLDRRGYIQSFAAVVVLSARPMTQSECEAFWLPVDSLISFACSQTIFDNAVLRALKRRNEDFPEETAAAQNQLLSDLLFHDQVKW